MTEQVVPFTEPSPNTLQPLTNSTELDNSTESIKQCKKKKKISDQGDKTYLCSQCPKKYSSQTSLNSHTKSKHNPNDEPPTIKKRGRPKKKTSPSPLPNQENTKKEPYFDNADKKGETLDFFSAFDEVVISHYQKQDHPLRAYIQKVSNKEIVVEKPCDYIFAEYLDYVSHILKRDPFKMVVKFVLLYRDCFNGTSIERSEREVGEKLPDKSNEFVAKLPKDSIPSRDAIEMTMHFCEWMFERSYTSLKLTLIPRNM